MTSIPATRMTLDEFLALPEGEPPYREFICGEIVEKPMPTPPHSAVVRELIIEIGLYLRGTPEARVDTELRHADRSEERAFLPDISVTRRTRFPHGQRRGPVEVSPDLAIEVLSPYASAGYVFDKVAFYLRSGTELVWVVDPDRETVMVYERGVEPRRLTSADTLDGRPVLTGFRLALADLFGRAGEVSPVRP